ncbi:L-lysine exporter family protein LysE/ArgO [Cricetibacter osteomyelitidis]|uniref:L-lysine exporter family protein LysE/ArgO n=1 Tax=Cricetibacter osteomyelitidis TaxID=1521931 RepID=A0A4R2T146_9PAST|nr:LysE/ArgO family amino acid transporter [Cricetibacter osteomyelitidis]TCP94806.1 L-lysine exporter family protein LysE/ArgO [Cricetibacter osteomyelitidis]
METILQGFLVTSGLIVAIGAQNAFVLKQGLLKQNTFLIALTCFLCDFVLMSIGVLGMGSLISSNPTASLVLAIVGAVFLFVYGLRSFISAYRGKSVLAMDNSQSKQTALKAVLLTLAVTLLNPHVYIDTVMILGSIAGTLSQSDKILFLIGGLLTSALWFLSLAYGARLLIPLFRRPFVWQVLDFIIGIVMWLIAASLVKYTITLN